MKRVYASLLALLLTLSLLVGCGGGAASSVSGSGSASVSQSTGHGNGFADASGSGSGSDGSDTSSSGSSFAGSVSQEPAGSVMDPAASSKSTGTAGASSSADKSDSSASSKNSDTSKTTGNTETTGNSAGTVSSGSAAQTVQGNTQTPAASGQAYVPKDVPFTADQAPAYSGEAYVAIHDSIPFFDTSKLTPVSVEYYSPLDGLGRCGVAYACVGQDIMPTEERGSIGQVKPTGWHTVKYDIVDGKYLYNRCHLVGYQLSAENANTSNLITGTRYLNIEGMLPFENLTADYVKETGNHVAYRVTPIFAGNELVARGVLMEGWSVEDKGDGVCFCVFCFNAQPGITIDYATGDSSQTGDGTSGTSGDTGTGTTGNGGQNSQPAQQDPAPAVPAGPSTSAEPPAQTQEPEPEPTPQGTEYIYNKNTKKFHYPSCSSVDSMKESNKGYFTGSRDELIAQGYEPCKRCNP